VAFRFSLAQVLRVRESVEKREEQALQRAEQEVAQTQRRIEDLTNEMAKVEHAREEALLRSIRAIDLQGMQAEMEAAVEARQTLLDTLETLKEQRDLQMKLYQEAHNGRQMLTDLEEEHRAEYEQEQTRAQQKRLDDLFAARAQRN
jgi:flagellar export protein FliJ